MPSHILAPQQPPLGPLQPGSSFPHAHPGSIWEWDWGASFLYRCHLKVPVGQNLAEEQSGLLEVGSGQTELSSGSAQPEENRTSQDREDPVSTVLA